MISRLRRKLPTTVQIILGRAIQSSSVAKGRGSFPAGAGILAVILANPAWGQAQWSPQPFVPNASMKPLSQAPTTPGTVTSSNPRTPSRSDDIQAKPAVVLRWRKSSISQPAAPITNASGSNRSAVVNSFPSYREVGNSRVIPAQFQTPQGQGIADSPAPAQQPLPNFDLPQVPLNPPQSVPGLTPPNPSFTPPSLESTQTNPPATEPGQPNLSSQPEMLTPSNQNRVLPGEPLRLGDGKQEAEAPSIDLKKEEVDDAPQPSNPFPRREENGNGLSPSDKRRNVTSVNCDDIRKRALMDDISTIALDISPRFNAGVDVEPEEEYKVSEKKRSAFAEKSPIRQWHDYRGQFIVDGRMTNLTRGKVVIETASGTQQRLPLNDLSDADLAFVSESWQLPISCTLATTTATPRNFLESDVYYRSSGLCHNPLYFEDVQLERYGHEIGPVLQPVVSTAHFFANIAVLPYKAGIHPMNECQYALGYYRPGSCAPWTVGPIPISLRGGLTQAAAVTGIVGALP